MTSLDIDIALQRAQAGIHGLDLGYEDDYFESANARYGGGRSSTRSTPNSALSSWFDDLGPYDRDYRHRRTNVDELVRRTNLAASLANRDVSPESEFALIHPVMRSDGDFPTDFRKPKTLEAMRLMDSM